MINKIYYFIQDYLEFLNKPNSSKIRDQIIKDILSVDPKKWFNPKLPDGKTNPFCGIIQKDENGKEIYKPIDYNIYKYAHPDLEYKIDDYPLITCKEGEYKNVTKKDCEKIRDIFYKIKSNN